MRNGIFPYTTLSRELLLTVAPIQLERITGEQSIKELISEEIVDSVRDVVELWASENRDWTNVILNLEAEILPGTSPKLEELSPEIQVMGVAICQKSNLRLAVPLRRTNDDGTRWQGVLKLDRRLAFGKVEVQVYLHGHALDRDARFFGESNAWRIYFDRSETFGIHGALPVKWVNFATDEQLTQLKEFSDEAFFLDLNEPEPTVYLNQGLEGLRTVFMERPRPTGTRLALHETLKTSIAKSVWLALFHTAADNLVAIDDEEQDVDWPTVQWQEDVLKLILPYIYPDRDEAGMLAALADDIRASTMSTVTSMALAYIGREIIHEGQSLRRAINQVEPVER